MTIADNDDLLIEILLCLPPKSLIRFKSVSKRWLAIISSHQFSNQHTLNTKSRPKQSPSFLIRLTDKSGYFYLQSGFHFEKLIPYHFPSTLVGPITIWSFSNGLFLLQCRHTEDPFKVFHVYNPTTKQSRRIILNDNDVYTCVVGLNLLFDPLESPHYKVVCVRKSSSFFCRNWWRHCQVEMYESKTSSWSLCGKPFVAPRSLQFDHGIYWKGGVHWKGGYFDLHNHDFVFRNHPRILVAGDDTGRSKFRNYYIEYNGYLHNVAHFPEEKLIVILELQSPFSDWSLKNSFNIDAVSGPVSVLNIVRGEEEGDDGMLVLYEAGKVRGCKLQENCVKELIDFTVDPLYQEGSAQFTSDCVLRINETLAPV